MRDYIFLIGLSLGYCYEILPVTPPVEHSEGPYWCTKTNTLYYVDTFKATVLRWSPDLSKQPESFRLDGMDSIGFIIPIKNANDTFLIFADRSVLTLNWPQDPNISRRLKSITTVEEDKPFNQFNDGKADSNGRVWGGTLSRNKDLSVADYGGSLYMFYNNMSQIVQKISNTSISNGMAWSKDNKKFYYIDTITRYIEEYDFNEDSGNISNKSVVLDLRQYPDIKGCPDGMTIDENNNLWIALFGGKSILQVNPTSGKILTKIEMPATYVTSVIFGGPDLNVLYVTTSRLKLQNNDQEPSAGSVFAIRGLVVKGLLPKQAIF